MEDTGPDNKQICIFDNSAKRWLSINHGFIIKTIPNNVPSQGFNFDIKCDL